MRELFSPTRILRGRDLTGLIASLATSNQFRGSVNYIIDEFVGESEAFPFIHPGDG